ncbi:MAG: S8 family serine peptidase [Gemmatimonadaceae bacterium]
MHYPHESRAPSRAHRTALVALAAAALVAACSDRNPLAPPTASLTPPSIAASRGSTGQGAASRYVVIANQPEGVTGTLTMQTALTLNTVSTHIRQLGGSIERAHANIAVMTVNGLSAAAAEELATRPGVEAVVPDLVVQWIPPLSRMSVHTASADQSGAAFFTRQWNMRVIRANNAWLITPAGAHTLACILDTGIDPGHLDLAGKVDLAKSTSFVVTEPDIFDRAAHGSFVAALVSSNGIGIASVAPNAKLCALKVLDQTGSGSFADLIAAIAFAADLNADVANMSLGALVSKKDPGVKQLIKALQRAVNYAFRRGTLSVAAAGNDALNTNTEGDLISIPAQLDHVISVGATAPTNQMNFDNIASYSEYGRKGVTVFAPGGDLVAGGVVEDLILSVCSRYTVGINCTNGRTYLFAAGTSFSAPHVTGEALVVKSVYPNADAARITHCILVGADHPTGRVDDPIYSRGRINVVGGARCSRAGQD